MTPKPRIADRRLAVFTAFLLLAISSRTHAGSGAPFIRGDANSDTTIDLSDAIFSLGYIVGTGPAPACIDAADVNDDGGVDIADPIALLGFLFVGGVMLPPPFPSPGVDPTPDGMICGSVSPIPEQLSATGLYDDIASGTIAMGVESYTPQYPQWLDGGESSWWVSLPAGSSIDNADEDHWEIPVGTQLWREVRVGGLRVETQWLKRIGPGSDAYVIAAYAWNASETEATHAPLGVTDARGTAYDIVDEATCKACHGGDGSTFLQPFRALGFSALQLSGDVGDVTYESLVTSGRLSMPGSPSGYAIPGSPVEQAALGYLASNCGGCHNPDASPYPLLAMDFTLSAYDTDVSATPTYQTAVGVPLVFFSAPGLTARIEPGAPDASGVLFRMLERGNPAQMPPLATEVVDLAGMQAISDWILSLP